MKKLAFKIITKIKKLNKAKKIILLTTVLLFFSFIIIFYFSLPKELFTDPYSIVVYDRDGALLGVKISEDQQWRFPNSENLNEKFKTCIINFEDKRFRHHFGIDPIAFSRAIKQNLVSSKIVSGGSTITMQTIRLMRKGKKRTFKEKFIEVFLALRLECGYSKDEILRLYVSHAPFGGNVVGIEAAAWRYFGRDQNNLSWSENAMLAVLPNSPSFINTVKNSEKLKIKRDILLKKLYDKKIISRTEYELAIYEEIPEHPQPYPMYAYHLVSRATKEFSKTSNKIQTTLDIKYQLRCNEIVRNFNNIYKQNNINNLACLVLEVETGNVVAYVGNADFNTNTAEKDVDMVLANRSTGSVLKPFLYAAALSDGEILPATLLKDVPTKIAGFSPENYDKQYSGAVPADVALAHSLNIPFVHLLRQYGIFKFLHILKNLGLSSINKDSDYYGLSLILGGAEANLWDLCSAYSSMARSLKYYTSHQSKYNFNSYFKANYLKNNSEKENLKKSETSFLNAASIWWTFEAMSSVNRPGDEKNWQNFSSKQKVAWKTGTSFGSKDAWAIAITPDYVIGVWVGNATGEPKAGILGQKIAAPVLFEILRLLPSYKNWFSKPFDNMLKLAICKKSGYIAGQDCEIIDSVFVPETSINTQTCPYHKKINLDETENFAVNSNCYPIDKIKRKSWFVLPPAMAYYYKLKNTDYQPFPKMMEGCREGETQKIMEIIYPNKLSKVYIPVSIQGDTSAAVFKIAHIDEDAVIYWFLNEKYVATTKYIHEKEFSLKAGNYILSLVDNKGNRLSRQFSVVSKLE
ncbi:MAG: penicillin-binding protein 1C [Bacteroidales bacterium]|jgi:penicillin-binding protein 1C|nr:penicillin-binding protein 1C [Bacteroidales bacterium]